MSQLGAPMCFSPCFCDLLLPIAGDNLVFLAQDGLSPEDPCHMIFRRMADATTVLQAKL